MKPQRTIILYDKKGVVFLRERVTNKQITRHRSRLRAIASGKTIPERELKRLVGGRVHVTRERDALAMPGELTRKDMTEKRHAEVADWLKRTHAHNPSAIGNWALLACILLACAVGLGFALAFAEAAGR